MCGPLKQPFEVIGKRWDHRIPTQLPGGSLDAKQLGRERGAYANAAHSLDVTLNGQMCIHEPL